MRAQSLSWLLSCVMALFLAASTSAAEGRTIGRIVAAKVQGTVTALNKADNTVREIHDNDTLAEGSVVTTAAKSSVVLLFANGSAVNLAADSSLSIDEFLIDPFDPKYSAAEAKDEPSTSVTKLSLARGELVGNVKHLHRDGGSSFTVNTPVGAAGIRGTTFRLLLQTDDQGKVTFTLSTSEGVVVLTDTAGVEHQIPAGKEIEVSFDTYTNDPQGRTGVIPSSIIITGIEDMPPDTQAAIQQAVQQILQTHASNLDTGSAPGAITPPSNTTPGDGSGG